MLFISWALCQICLFEFIWVERAWISWNTLSRAQDIKVWEPLLCSVEYRETSEWSWIDEDKYPCLRQDSNPRSASKRSRPTPQTAPTLGPAPPYRRTLNPRINDRKQKIFVRVAMLEINIGWTSEWWQPHYSINLQVSCTAVGLLQGASAVLTGVFGICLTIIIRNLELDEQNFLSLSFRSSVLILLSHMTLNDFCICKLSKPRSSRRLPTLLNTFHGWHKVNYCAEILCANYIINHLLFAKPYQGRCDRCHRTDISANGDQTWLLSVLFCVDVLTTKSANQPWQYGTGRHCAVLAAGAKICSYRAGSSCRWRETVSERRPPTGLLFIPKTICEYW
jgi:hypothetical protein